MLGVDDTICVNIYIYIFVRVCVDLCVEDFFDFIVIVVCCNFCTALGGCSSIKHALQMMYMIMIMLLLLMMIIIIIDCCV